MGFGVKSLLAQTFRFLTFQSVAIDNGAGGKYFAAAVIIYAWIAGLGRYWDHPSAAWWQYAGLGSVAYIFALATFLFLLIKPLRPARWRWMPIFIFVGLTSPLAWLYAIPVERFLSPQLSIQINIWFLVIVALWRVALYAKFLWSYANLRHSGLVAALLAPLAIILIVLSAFNLEHAVFEVMAGIEQERTQTEDIIDARYSLVLVLTILSLLTVPIWAIAYAVRLFKVYARKTS